MDNTEIFERTESQVRSYCRNFDRVFKRAVGAELFDAEGHAYIDFLAGCSSLNYGHNDPDMKSALLDYIASDGIAHGLDMYTEAKQEFLKAFQDIVLSPRGLDYRLQFTGPTGANAVEAALKLARKVTGRHNIIAFSNGFHGVTLGALACTGNRYHRNGAATPLSGVTRMPYDGYFGDAVDTAAMLEKMLDDNSSGVEIPAAIIVETVQGEGGLNAASATWLRSLQRIAHKHGALLIIDDIQAGCGRTGTMLSFETMGIEPDIVTMAKSLSGMGLPLSLVLLKAQHDIWQPAEHNGTFRGNNHALITARVALEKFWSNDEFARQIKTKGEYIRQQLEAIAVDYGYQTRGRGMFRGIDVGDGDIAAAICRHCFQHNLIIETSGPDDNVVKLLPPLTIEQDKLDAGLEIIKNAFAAAGQRIGQHPSSVAA